MMTRSEMVRAKSRIYALLGVGIAALYGGYHFAATPPPEGTPSLVIPLIFVAIGVICFLGATLISRKLAKEIAPHD